MRKMRVVLLTIRLSRAEGKFAKLSPVFADDGLKVAYGVSLRKDGDLELVRGDVEEMVGPKGVPEEEVLADEVGQLMKTGARDMDEREGDRDEGDRDARVVMVVVEH